MRGDEDLSFAIKKALAKDMELSAMDIRVNTLNGVVHLDGVVDVLGDREYAEKVIREIDGVQDIVNRLSIGMERRVRDDELAHAVESKLTTRDEEYRRIGVAVKKGVVHLYGEVENLADEKDILTAAMDVLGVREVVSHLKIQRERHGLPIDDATVVNNIRLMLASDQDINRAAISVEVENGKVVLSGTVESVEDKQIAGKLASMAHGVRDVINELRSHQGGTGGEEALAATIRNELEKDPNVSAAQVQVIVEDGMVFIGGEVDSPDAEDAAIKVVKRVLRNVENVRGFQVMMTISGAKGSLQRG